jgi:hypothetical protein
LRKQRQCRATRAGHGNLRCSFYIHTRTVNSSAELGATVMVRRISKRRARNDCSTHAVKEGAIEPIEIFRESEEQASMTWPANRSSSEFSGDQWPQDL